MHAAKLLAEAIELARQLNFQIREEDLEGAGGGHCVYAGKKWLLLDLTQSADEQLRDVVDALRSEGAALQYSMSAPLRDRVQLTKAA
jgi:hypothetical protein